VLTRDIEGIKSQTESLRKDIEWRKCELSCKYFLSKYAYIQNKNTAQTVKWEPWDYLLDLIDDFLGNKEIVILKARQLGVSWLLCGYCTWVVLFNDSAKVLYLSQGETEAFDMIGKSRFIWEHLPDFLRINLKNDTRSHLSFYVNNSEMKALPSTDRAGRSTDATVVIRDELANHPYGAENFAAIGPTIDGGGQLIDCSTIDKLDTYKHFTERVVKAHNNDSNAFFKFLGWNLRPVRQEGMTLEEWFDLRVRPKYSAFQIEQEYPATYEEAMRPSQTRSFFDVESTEDMLSFVQKPIEADINTHNGMVKIYKKPVVGGRYCVFADPSDGKDDPHAIIVMDSRTGEEMACSHGKVPADVCASIHDELVRYFNNAFNTYEVNATAGGKFAETIEKLETPNRKAFRKGQLNLKDKGWWTSASVKKDMLYGLEEAVRKRLIIVHTREAIEEFKSFIQPENGDPQARKGSHDDYIMAWAGVWQIRKFVPHTTPKIVSFEYAQKW